MPNFWWRQLSGHVTINTGILPTSGCLRAQRTLKGDLLRALKYLYNGKVWTMSRKTAVFLLLSIISLAPLPHSSGTFDSNHLQGSPGFPGSMFQAQSIESGAIAHCSRTAGPLPQIVHPATVSVFDSPTTHRFSRIVKLGQWQFPASLFVSSAIQVRAPPQPFA